MHLVPIQNHEGFTLIELMVVIAVLVIFVMIALPSFSVLMSKNRTTSAANELLYSLQIARSEAVKRNIAVSLCPSKNQTTCSGDGNWHLGWIIFIDVNENGVMSSGDTIIKAQGALDSSLTFIGPTSVQYATGGYLQSVTLTSIKASVSGSTEDRWVCITAIGKAGVQKTTC